MNKKIISKNHLANIEFAVVDIETTGFSHNYDKIIEVGAVKLKNGKIIDTYGSLIYTEYIPYCAYQVHKISASMVQDAPPLVIVKKEFRNFIKGCVLVGHNIKCFDRRFLCAHFNISDKVQCIDTIKMSRLLFSNKKCHKLSTVANRLGVGRKEYHRALKDAIVNAKIFLKFLNLGKDKFRTLDDIIEYKYK